MAYETILAYSDSKGVGIKPPEEAFLLARPQHDQRFLEAQEKRNKEYGGAPARMPKTLLIVAGHEGAGKTTATSMLEPLLDIGVVDKDPISNTFSTARSHKPDDAYVAMRPIVYEIMYKLAEEHLQAGRSAILDAPFHNFKEFFENPEWAQMIQDIAERTGAVVKVVWCEAPPEVKFKRLRNRKAPEDLSRTDEDLWKLASREDRPEFPFTHLPYSTENPDPFTLADFLEMTPQEREQAA